MNKKATGVILFSTLLLLIGGVSLAFKLGNNSAVDVSSQAKVEATETSYDWGTIGINDGIVTKDFEITNQGTAPLKLSNASTSCMCTTAQLSYADQKSPIYGMHSKSGYMLELPPQKTATLTVSFDPAFHGPNGTGPITRQVSVQTNDPSTQQLNFILKALVK